MPRKRPNARDLTRRERQIMDVIYARGRASAQEVQDGIPDAPSYSAVRALLRLLEDKGHLRHVEDGPRYVYMPTTPHTTAARSALDRVVSTFFAGSVEETVATLLDARSRGMSDDELDRLARLIDEARKEGR
jgi:BlaI family transcriptional regulator, penicillinase repressor